MHLFLCCQSHLENMTDRSDNTHTTVLLLFWDMSGTTRMSRYQTGKTRKVKTNLDLLAQEIVSGSGICWAICKSAPYPRQPRQHPTTQFFYRPDAFPAAQPTVRNTTHTHTQPFYGSVEFVPDRVGMIYIDDIYPIYIRYFQL